MGKIKEPIEQITEWLTDRTVTFNQISEAYVDILEKQQKEKRELITDLAYTASIYRTPKMNMGTKEQLEKQFAENIIKSGVFKNTPFENELKDSLQSQSKEGDKNG